MLEKSKTVLRASSSSIRQSRAIKSSLHGSMTGVLFWWLFAAAAALLFSGGVCSLGARRAVLFRKNDTPASFATAAAAVWTKNKPAHARGNDPS